MKLLQPPGARTTFQDPDQTRPGLGGTWNPCQKENGGRFFWDEFHGFLDSLHPSDRSLLRAEIKSKLERGQVGRLVYGEDSSADVCLIDSARFVLELRLTNHSGFIDDDPEGEVQARHTRLYFTEPEEHDGLLLLLFLTSKCPGKIGLAEQDQHAAIAAYRADVHCMRM